MSETVKTHWPDEVRLKMIEKSEIYSDTRVYQYGFYDGFQHAQSQSQELIDQNRELMEMLEQAKEKLYGCQDPATSTTMLAREIEELITEHKQTERRS